MAPFVHGAAFVEEEFSTDPVGSGRFIQAFLGTEGSFAYDTTNKSLLAVLDVDYDIAYYLSDPPAPTSASQDFSFSFNFRVLTLDNRTPPSAFIGLVTTQHVALNGDGLTAAIGSSTNGLPTLTATVDQGQAHFGGETLVLGFNNDYLAIARYSSSNRLFTVEAYGGSSFATLVGRSTAPVTNSVGFTVDRLGLQNDGGKTFDYTNGSITLQLDNLFIPARLPVNLSITNLVVDELDTDLTNAVFRVSLSSPTIQTVRVDFVTADVTAVSGQDYVSQTGTLTFLPGTTVQTISIPIIPDVLSEPNETLKLLLTNVVNAGLAVSEAVATIRDNDRCEASIDDSSATEVIGLATPAVFRVSLTTSNSQTVTLSYNTVNGSAVAPLDYLSTNGSLTFLPGETTKLVTVLVLGDDLDETNETFSVLLGNVVNAIVADAQGQCIITNVSSPPTVSLEGFKFITEGNAALTNVLVAAQLSKPSGKPVILTLATSNLTATAGTDYDGVVTNVTIPPGQTNFSLPITIHGDRTHELDESFRLHLLAAQNAGISNSVTLIQIQDDDPMPAVEILSTSVVEGDVGVKDATFVVRLTNPTYEPVSVRYATANGTATAGEDYLSTNGTLNWPLEAANSLSIRVQVIGDTINETDETFAVILNTPIGVTLGVSQGTCVVTNDDLVCISVGDVQLLEGNGGSQDVLFPVTLSGPAAQDITVRCFTRNGTAAAGTDYLTVSNLVLNFPIGIISNFVVVPVLGDIGDEPNETFTLFLTNAVNGLICRTNGICTIVDDDPPAIFVDNITVDEGTTNPNTVVFNVSLSSTSALPVSVGFSTSDGSATANSDYLPTNGVLTFPPGVRFMTVPVVILVDTNFEATETFFLNLNSPQFATLGVGQGICTLVNDDSSPWVYINDDILLFEGGCTNFVVTLSEPSLLPVVFRYCLTQAPTNVFVLCGGSCPVTEVTNILGSCRSNCCTFVIPPGVVSTNITICAGDNGFDEDEEIDFDGDLEVLDGSGRDGGDGAGGDGGGGMYVDNDPPVIVIDRPQQPVGVLEGNSGTTNLVFTIRLTTRHDTNVSVDFFSANGGALAGSDYLGTNGTIVFPPGVKTQQVSLQVFGDITYETNETLFLVLTNVRNATLTNTLLTGIITNDDLPPRITIDDPTVVEGDFGTNVAIFNVSLLTPTELVTVVGFGTIHGTATNTFDYLPTNSSLTFPVGVTNLQVLVPVIGDTFDEIHETFFLRLNNAPLNATLAKTNGIGTIIDDDPPEIHVNDVSIVEGQTGSSNLFFGLTLSTTSAVPVTVQYFTRDGGATSNVDYAPVAGTLTFAPGETNLIVPVSVFGDLVTETNEILYLSLTNAVNGNIRDSEGIGLILDDDAPCISITNIAMLEPVSGTAFATFDVVLDYPSSLDVSVNYTTSNLTASAGEDYVGKSGTVSLRPGQTRTNISIEVLSDLAVEADEQFRVVLSNPVNGKLCLSNAVATIRDATIPPNLAATAISVVEGDVPFANQQVVVTLSRASPQVITFDYFTADGTANNGSDYQGASGRITILPGTTTTNFAIRVNGDCAFEGEEDFWLVLTNAPLANITTPLLRCVIIDDDPPPAIFIRNSSVSECDFGLTTLTFDLWLSCRSSFIACVDLATADGSAFAGLDYIATNGTVCFPPGTTNATFRVSAKGDLAIEETESFRVLLSNPQFAGLGTNQAVGVILDDDNIRLSVNPITANEGSTARFQFTLSAPPCSERTVSFQTLDVTTTAGQDYVPANGIIRFPAGVTNQFIDVQILSDQLDETNEVFLLSLGNPTNLVLVTDRASCTIIDGNPPCLFVNDTNVIDDGSGALRAEFTIFMSSTSALPVSVSFATMPGSAVPGTDYISKSGTVNFAPGMISTNIQVLVLPNSRDETNEYFCVELFSPVSATICKALGCNTVINPTVSNTCPVVSLELPRNGDCFTGPTNIVLAANAVDPDGRINSVTFYAGATRIEALSGAPYQTTWFNAPIGEHLLSAVALDNVGCVVTSIAARVSVRLPAKLSIDDKQVVEGNVGTNAIFRVSLDSPSCSTVRVDAVTLNGTAISGIDYQPVVTNLVFPPGAIERFVSVPVVGETLIESNESFFVLLTNWSNTAVGKGIGIGTILNDDTNDAPTVRIISPLTGSVFYTPPGVISILADALDADGFIRQVEFYAGTNRIGLSTNSPFALQWSNTTTGTFALTAVATDDDGAQAISQPVSITVVRCSGILGVSPLTDRTNCACGEVAFGLSITSPEPVSITWKMDGREIPGATGTNLVLRGLKGEDAGLYTVVVSTPCQTITRSARLTLEGAGMSSSVNFSNNAGIVIGEGPAAPYPSVIDVRCVPGLLTNLSVTIRGLTHTFAGDVDILLVSPSGKAIMLMSDVAENTAEEIHNANLTFGREATAFIPQSGPILSGTYAPTNYVGDGPDPSPPAGVTLVTNLTALTGASPNGKWGLYVLDDATLDVGQISGGWSIAMQWDSSAPRLQLSRVLPDGRVQLSLTSHPNQTHLIEGSFDLVNWFPISTNAMAGTNMSLVVPAPLTHGQCFYRVVRCPCVSPGCFSCVAHLSAPTLLSDGRFQMVLNSAPGKTHVIEGSSDLIHWVPVSTNTLNTVPTISVVMPNIRNAPQRFYRATRCL